MTLDPKLSWKKQQTAREQTLKDRKPRDAAGGAGPSDAGPSAMGEEERRMGAMSDAAAGGAAGGGGGSQADAAVPVTKADALAAITGPTRDKHSRVAHWWYSTGTRLPNYAKAGARVYELPPMPPKEMPPRSELEERLKAELSAQLNEVD